MEIKKAATTSRTNDRDVPCSLIELAAACLRRHGCSPVTVGAFGDGRRITIVGYTGDYETHLVSKESNGVLDALLVPRGNPGTFMKVPFISDIHLDDLTQAIEEMVDEIEENPPKKINSGKRLEEQ